MRILILFAFFVAASGKAQLLVDLDKYSLDTPSTYDAELDGKSVDIQFAKTCDDGNGQLWEDGYDGKPESAHVFPVPQCKFFRIPNDPNRDSCTGNVDNCTNGLTFVAKVKPARPAPDDGTFSWLFGLGFGSDQLFGMRVGFKNARIVVWIISTHVVNKIECDLPFTEEKWYSLGVIRGPSEWGKIRILVDGKRIHEDNCKRIDKRERNLKKEPLPSVIRNEIDVGAAKGSDDVKPVDAMYGGSVDQLCFYARALLNGDVKRANKGCFNVE